MWLQILLLAGVVKIESNIQLPPGRTYRWGPTHNGAARMDRAHAIVSSETLTITAQPVNGQPPAGHGGKQIAIKYLSGAVHGKKQLTVTPGGGFDFVGSFRATTTKGTWPAFWLTAVKGWPPEIDLAEWKGSGKISFNTFNASNQVASKNIDFPRPESFHDIKTELRDKNGKDVEVKFHMDGQLVATQVGRGYVGQAFWLIVNLQMEGSSGAPGPSKNTTYAMKNLHVISYNK
ncbi:hypothetical protein EJ08DRAFT_673350 [Tothia fuscella]|uniref:GH16 domain-containing protein n=1 Tax=Tothia fuscella TaxID=1048955 RepID=A0A9P4NFI7_9PEZI|nr:hypothetical protein EJ08DRAFT_673350 [Tothia fuscella]